MGAAIAAAILVLAGCQREVQELIVVQGVLKDDRGPLPNVYVQFIPEEKPGSTSKEAREKPRIPASSGITDSNGRFTLRTNDGRQGAVPGMHLVILEDLDAAERARDDGGADTRETPRRFSEDYARLEYTPLTSTVRKGMANVELTVDRARDRLRPPRIGP